MDNLSYKAKIIYAAMDNLGAKGKDNKITSYAILDYIVEESEVLQEHELVKDIPEDKYVDFTIDVNIKSINTILTSLAKKNIITKTEPMNLKIDGVTRNLRQYYLNNGNHWKNVRHMSEPFNQVIVCNVEFSKILFGRYE